MRNKLVKVIAYTFFSALFLCVVILGAEIVFRFMPVYNREWMDYNSITVWRMKANNQSKHWTPEHPDFMQVINRDGFNDVNHEVQKKEGIKRIMVIGDSYTAGLDYPVTETFTGILQQKLNEKFPDKFEVMNCGVPAWGLEQEFLYLVNEGKKYKPDYVLLMVTPNDIRETYTRNFLTIHDTTVETWLMNPMTKPEKIAWKLYARSAFTVWMRKNKMLPKATSDDMFWKYFGRSFPDFPPFKEWDVPLFLKQEPWQVTEANKKYSTILSALNNHCKEINARLLLGVNPIREELDTTFSNTSKYQADKVEQWLDTVCASKNIPYCKTLGAAKQLNNPLTLFQSWEFHLNPEGHQFMGEQLFHFFADSMERKN